MMTRRGFLTAGLIGGLIPSTIFSKTNKKVSRLKDKSTVISTWNQGIAANKAALRILKKGQSALDAVEEGVKTAEADPKLRSVGYGGRPDEDGHVTLDACIMDSKGNAGAVAFLQDIMHPVSVARKVMERTDHVFLVGEGAKKFALAHGFKETNLLTDESREEWLKWKENLSVVDDWGPNENHDTISLLAQDSDGNLSAACTTSGLAYKIQGRVGDSPIIGAGMFCDNQVGAAGATGKGEEVIKTAGSFLVVEFMRQGYPPQKACEEALLRIKEKHRSEIKFQVAYIALRIDGEIGASALKDGFKYALYKEGRNKLNEVKGLL